MSKAVFGIDLGTTNSVIAWVRDGVAEVIRHEGESVMPSVVGLDGEGALLVGTPARNQLAAYPDRTVASIKRAMGEDRRIALGERDFSPEEVSAVILRELARRAEAVTGEPVKEVVITVPAFFQDAQRQATRVAGEIAGLDVLRVLNEPTAAALAFDAGDAKRERCLLVYDLGGGTFDVSIVRSDGELVEVLASHGDTRLGGDDFDRLLADDLAQHVCEQGGEDPRLNPVLDRRLLMAAEAAKIRLSEDVDTRVREEFFGSRAGTAEHLDCEISRENFEERVAPLLEKTLDSVHQALSAAGIALSEVDDVLLVGGSTRSPIVGERLQDLTGKKPRRDVDPDLCVALGAAIQAARLAGQEHAKVLVDVTPYSFGPSHLGDHGDGFDPDCFTPVIERGTPLPVSRSEAYYTCFDNQEAWDVRIFQGESRNARENILVGRFLAQGLSAVPAGNQIVCKMTLDLDGILSVEVVEKSTGLSKRVTIEGAASQWTEARLAEARERTLALWGDAETGAAAAGIEVEASDEETPDWVHDACRLLARGKSLSERMAREDREEFDELATMLGDAIAHLDEDRATSARDDLEDLIHYVEEA